MSLWPETNDQLIVRAKNSQDAEAWEELVSVYRPVLYRMARRHHLSHENAEDVIQSVFLSVSRAIPKWQASDQGPRFRNWLGRITRNCILNVLSRARPDQATGSTSIIEALHSIVEHNGLAGDKDLSNSPMSGILLQDIRSEAIRRAASLIQKDFSKQTWEIFQAVAIEGQEPKEVAQAFGVSVGTVYACRCRVIAKLRTKTEELSHLWEEKE
jgi:RNA polymerase sigma-70 factor (ECF subfamily)